jgi:hypothetical protein
MLRAAAGIDGIEIAERPVVGASHPLQGLFERLLSTFAPYFAGECSFDRRGLEGAVPDLAGPPPMEAAYLRRLIEFGRSAGWVSRPLEDPPPRPCTWRPPAAARAGEERPCATS